MVVYDGMGLSSVKFQC